MDMEALHGGSMAATLACISSRAWALGFAEAADAPQGIGPRVVRDMVTWLFSPLYRATYQAHPCGHVGGQKPLQKAVISAVVPCLP